MLHKIIVISCLLLLMVFAVKAQSSGFLLKGRAAAADTADLSPLNGMVSVLKADSTLLKQGPLTNGKFEIENITEKAIAVKIYVMGYHPATINVVNDPFRTVLELGVVKIYRSSQKLNEVEITSRPPVINHVNGNVVVNVQDNILASSTTMEELFSKTPGLSSGGEGVTVTGKGEAIVYYNGQRITSERLKSLQVSQIKSIEIITNPSAKYDAQGKAIVRIAGKKITDNGLSGKIRQDFSQGDYFNSNTDLSLDYKLGKVVLSGGYNQRTFNRRTNITSSYRQLDTSHLMYNSNGQYDSYLKADFIPTYRLGISYDIDQRNNLSLEYNGNNTTQRRSIMNENHISFNRQVPDFYSLTQNESKISWNNNSVSLNYSRQLDDKGGNLLIAAQYFSEHYSLGADISNLEGKDALSFFLSNSKNRIKFYSFNADLEKKIFSGLNFMGGLKFTQATSSSIIDFRQWNNGDYHKLDNFSNDYVYDEYLPAAYAEAGGEIKGLKYSVGLRVEGTVSKGYSNKLQRYLLDSSYVNPFPYLSVSKKMGAATYGFSYATRLGRPSYDDLDPYIEYNGSSLVVKGSPALKPSYTHSLEIYREWKDYQVKFGYAYTKNEMSASIYQFSDSGSIAIQKVNLRDYNSIYLNISFPIEAGNLTSQNSVVISYDKLSDARFPNPGFNAFPVVSLNSINTYTIKGWFDIEGVLNYSTEGNNAIVRSYNILYMEAALSRKFFDKKLSTRLSFQDAFRTYREKTMQSYDSKEYINDRKITNRLVRLSITYKFGTQKNNYRNKAAGQEAVDRAR